MNDTYLTVVGNLVTVPERRRLENSGATVVNFRIGSTARRFDKATGGWVDGNTFFVKVSCWRGLADNVYQSLFKGDPVVVYGRLYTREYLAEDGSRRTAYEMEATALGHNLARGTATFLRTRTGQPADVVEPPDHDEVLDGDAATGAPAGRPVEPAREAPVNPGPGAPGGADGRTGPPTEGPDDGPGDGAREETGEEADEEPATDGWYRADRVGESVSGVAG